MSLLSQPLRPRYVFGIDDRVIWQGFLEELVRNAKWKISVHVRNDICDGRVSQLEINRLKSLEQWYVWALELGSEDATLEKPKPKFLLRYPSPDPDKWQITAVVAIMEPLLIITIYPKS